MRQRLRLLLWVCLVCGGTGLLLTWTGVHCPIRYLTGIPCPGCGMTRACLTLAFGPGGLGDRLVRAFQYHPLVVVIPPLLLYAIFGKWPLFGGKKQTIAVVCGVCALMLLVYVARLALGDRFLWGAGPA